MKYALLRGWRLILNWTAQKDAHQRCDLMNQQSVSSMNQHEVKWRDCIRLVLLAFNLSFFKILSEVNPLCIFVTVTCGSKIYPIYICTRPHFFSVVLSAADNWSVLFCPTFGMFGFRCFIHRKWQGQIKDSGVILQFILAKLSHTDRINGCKMQPWYKLATFHK